MSERTRIRLLAGTVGLFSAGIGVGGGAILVPALVHLERSDFRRASSLSLATIAPISLVGALTHGLLLGQSLPLGKLVAFIAAGAVGVMIGSRLAKHLPTRGFTLAFAGFLLLVGLKMTAGWNVAGLSMHAMEQSLTQNSHVALGTFGVAVGMTSSLLGVGCGLVIVPFCVYGLGFGIHVAIVFSLVTMFFLTSAGAIARYRKGLLDTPVASKMIPAALIGAVIGASLTAHLPDMLLRQVFGAFLLVLGVKYVIEDIARGLSGRLERFRHAEGHD